jgi:hypothetical protein
MKKSIFVSIILLISCECLLAQGGMNSLLFDGENDYVNCGNDTSVNLSEQLTIEAWVKGSIGSTYARIVDKYNFFSQQGFNMIRNPGNNGVMLDFWATDGSKHTCGSSKVVFDGQWHYVATTFDGTQIKVYVDGRFEGVLNTGDKLIQLCPHDLMIGNGFDGGTWFPFWGYIDEVRLWNVAIDSVTIRNWTHKKITPGHPYLSNLVGSWRFNEGSGTIAGDTSGTGNHGVLTNMDSTSCWVASTAPFASSLTDTLLNVSACWVSMDSNFSSIFSIEDNDISGDDCIIFGHSDAEISWIDTDVPSNLGIANRLNRIWKMEVYDTLAGTIIFDIADLGVNNESGLMLLYDSNTEFTDSDTSHGVFDPVKLIFSVSQKDFKHGYYYTLGSTENLASIEQKIINQSNILCIHSSPNPFTTSTTLSFRLFKPENVKFTVYNVQSQIVFRMEEIQNVGEQKIVWNAEGLPAGMYYYRLVAGDRIASGKLVVRD